MRSAAAACAALLIAACATAPLPGAPAPLPSQPPESTVPAPPTDIGRSRTPTPAESALITTLMRETERLRALRFRSPVEVRIEDRAAMRAYVRSALADEDLAKARRRYVALGLLEPALDIRELIESLMEEELIGYYDPKRKVLALRDRAASSLASRGEQAEDLEWRATVVHELVHALQDQHLGLSAAMEIERTTDQENAYASVVEGDATLAMLAYMAERQGASLEVVVSDVQSLATSLRSGRAQPGGRLESAPAIVREPLLFRYREGALFAAQLFARDGWRGVDEAHRAPPQTTLAVREPQRYLERREEPPLPLPELSFLSTHHCSEVDRDALGGLELGAALGTTSEERLLIERAWRGDRYAVLACAEADASVWFVRFASTRAAQQASRLFGRTQVEGEARRVVLAHGAFMLAARGLPAAAFGELLPLFRAWASAPR